MKRKAQEDHKKVEPVEDNDSEEEVSQDISKTCMILKNNKNFRTF